MPQKMTGFVGVLWLKYTATNNFFPGLSDLMNSSGAAGSLSTNVIQNSL